MKYTTATAFAMATAGAVAQDSWGQWSSTSSSSSWDPAAASSTEWESWTASASSTVNPASSSATWESWTASSSAVNPASTGTWEAWTASSASTVNPQATSTWAGWTTCPATVTVVKTATATAWQSTVEIYEKTVTIPVPAQPATVNIQPEWAEWSTSSSTVAPVYTLPAGCSTASTATTTSTSTTTVAGTTTVTGSTLYLAVGTGAAGASAVSSAVAPAQSSSAAGWNGGSNNGGSNAGSPNNNNGGSGIWNGGTGTTPNGGSPVGPGLSGIIPGGVLPGGPGSNGDVFSYVPLAPAHTHAAGAAPAYTQGPDGVWSGQPWGGKPIGDDGSHGWQNWPSNGNGGSGSNGTSGPVPPPGSAGSNITAPFQPLTGPGCNAPGSRGSWCNGSSTSTNYYEDYFTGQTQTYTLEITNGTANHDGKDVLTFLINGQFPGPLIEANWGDWVEVTVVNKLQVNGTAIHWHGVRQKGTNDQDGVPGVTECAIAPGQSKTYKWHASSYGTSWYHSHWDVQYGEGVIGPIVIHGPATADYDVDAGPVVLTETYNNTAFQENWLISHIGPLNTVNYLMNGKNVVNDLSSGQHALWSVKKGQKYLFRIINAATQNMFSVSIDQHTMTVMAADFVPIVPYTTQWLNIGVGQRYDIVVEMDQAVDSYFFRAVTQTLCPSACDNDGLGQANGIIAYQGVQTSPYLLPTSSINGNKTIADFAVCIDEPLSSLSPFLVLPGSPDGTSSAFQSTATTIDGGGIIPAPFPGSGTVFQWFLNNAPLYINWTQPTLKSINEDVSFNATYGTYENSHGYNTNTSVYANNIVLEKANEWYYFVIQNTFFAYHPMHLHGHDMAILGQGYNDYTGDISSFNFENPMRRDTVMLLGNDPTLQGPPTSGGYTVIGFQTDNPGAWLMHCHIAWHVEGGLAIQWIEVPEEIKGDGYQGDVDGQCAAFAAYQSENSDYLLPAGSSGLRRRDDSLYFDRLVAEQNKQFKAVVRRDESAHRYLSSHLKRGLGDGSSHRRFGRR